MTDLHTHILPAMDDGAKDVEQSLQMLRMEYEQGVDTVVLTPHFYRNQETVEEFLKRRARAFDALKEGICGLPPQEKERIPKLLLGAEVAWTPNIAQLEGLSQLCIGDTNNLLLELPFYVWNGSFIAELCNLLIKNKITFIFAHIERFLKGQKREYMDEVLSLGAPLQINAGALLNVISRSACMKLIEEEYVCALSSDCHDTHKRKPDLAQGFKVLERRLGQEAALEIAGAADMLAGVSQPGGNRPEQAEI